ncbi:hypothetical protein San01_51760 [Streptomyces angustmyceticus]|uniref:Uncharacterized protein n=1 Tax=Streptomyces angustmyceticus TaxID=285578 RepID=A0A5J4LQI3_9ACTN|nr:hypothetical protein San01_51760 [Streptomyces angustmyceticus]
MRAPAAEADWVAVSSPPARAAQATALTATGVRSERRDGMHASEGDGGWSAQRAYGSVTSTLRASISCARRGVVKLSPDDREGTRG